MAVAQTGRRHHAQRTGGAVKAALSSVIPAPAFRAASRVGDAAAATLQRRFERRYGVRTTGHVYLDHLGLDDDDRAFYQGIDWVPLKRALASLDPGPDDVFVDLGSGKGQALIVAGQFPLRRVIGVDLAEELNAAARENVAQARPKLRATEFDVLTADALAWDVPDDLSIVFMFCPFTGPVFERAMQRILVSHDRRPRPLHIVYAYPWEHNRLLATGRVEVVDVRSARWPSRPWWPWSGWVMPIYRVVPRGQAPVTPRPRGLPLRRQAIRRWCEPTDQRFALYRPDKGLIFDL